MLSSIGAASQSTSLPSSSSRHGLDISLGLGGLFQISFFLGYSVLAPEGEAAPYIALFVYFKDVSLSIRKVIPYRS